MKKGAITSLVFTCVTFVVSIVAIVLSYRSALTPVSIEHLAQGFTLRMSFSSSFGVAISSISVMTMILGCSLLIISVLLLCLTIGLFKLASMEESKLNRPYVKKVKKTIKQVSDIKEEPKDKVEEKVEDVKETPLEEEKKETE